MDQGPHNLCQWLAYIGVVFLGVLFAVGIQWIFMEHFLRRSLWAKEGDKDVYPEAKDAPATHKWIGAMEIVLYASSVVYGKPEFIAAWFATKYVASYKVSA
jgi:hypothetical protein